MGCGVKYNGQEFTDEQFRDYVSANPEEFKSYLQYTEPVYDSAIGGDFQPEHQDNVIMDSAISAGQVEDRIRQLYKPFTYSTWEDGTIQLSGRSNDLNRGRIAEQIKNEFGLSTLKGGLKFEEKQSKKGIKYRTITIDRSGLARLINPQAAIFDSSIGDLEDALKNTVKDQQKFDAQLERLVGESAKVEKVVSHIKEESIRSKLRDSLRYIKDEKKDVKNFVYFLLEAKDVLKYYAEELKKVEDLSTPDAINKLFNAQQIASAFRDTITFLKKDFRFVDDANQFKGLIDELSSNYEKIENIYGSEAEVLAAKVIAEEVKGDAKLAYDKLSADLKTINEQIAKAENAGAKQSYIDGLRAKADKIKKNITNIVPDAQNIEDSFKGLKGDVNWLSGNFRSTLAMGDPIISGYSRRLKRGFNEVRRKLMPLKDQTTDQLNTYMKATGVTANDSMANFYKGLYDTQTINTYDDAGNVTSDTFYALSGPVNQSFYNDDAKFRNDIKQAKKTGDIDKITEAQKAYNDWLNTYAERQYVEAWYERFNLLTPEAYEERQKIIDTINGILRGPNRDSLSTEDLETVADLKYDLKRLSSLRDDQGELKTGKDLEVAQSIQAFNKKTAEMSYWETTPENQRWFNIIVAKKKEQVSQGLITQQDFDTWFSANTQRNISQDFYRERQVIIDNIQSIMSKLPKEQFKSDIKKLWDTILDVSKPYRDEDNIMVGNDVSAPESTVVRSSEEAIEELKSKLIRFSGLTIEEEQELQGLWGNLDSLTPGEIERFMALRDQSQQYKDYLGRYISKLELNALMSYFGQLAAISKWEPTTYYTTTYNQNLHEFRVKVDPNFLQDLKYVEEKFKSESEWYKKNHITKTKKTFEEGKTRFTEEDEPLYIWKDIIPTNPDWVQKDAPGFAFKTRIIKPEYTNQKYRSANFEYFKNLDEEDMTTVPKRFVNEGGDVKKSSYINENYERLKESTDIKDNARFDMLNFLLNTHLLAQKDLPKYKRLGYFLPGTVKDQYDRLREQGIKGLKKSILSSYSLTQEDKDLTLGDTSQIDLSVIPVKYSTKVKPEDQDLDLLGGVMKHKMGVEEYSYLEKELPYAKIIQSALKSAPNDVSQSQIDRALANMGFQRFIKGTKESQRSKTFDSFVRTMFYGESQTNAFNSAQATKIINSALGIATLQVMTFNIPAHITNLLSGEIQNIIESAGGKYMKWKDYLKAKSIYAANIKKFWDDYGREGNNSFWTALSERLDVPQGEFENQYGEKTKFSRMRDIKNHIMFIKQAGEHEIQISTMIAMSLNYKVKLEDKMVSLNDALELKNGEIEIKHGVKNADGTDFTEDDLNKFQDRVHSIVRQLNGAYSKIDKTVAEKSVLGKLAFYMRKYFLPMAYRRFEDFKYDYEDRDFKEGYYRTAFNILKDFIKMNKDLVNNWDTYKNTLTSEQKRNLRAFMSEVGIITALAVTILAIGGYDKDRDLKGRWVYTMVLYELMKMKSEAETLLPIPGAGLNELSSLFSSPFVPATAVKNAKNLIGHGIDALGDAMGMDIQGARYNRDYGIWNEGDLRVKADALKLIGLPVNLLTPENLVKNFELRNR